MDLVVYVREIEVSKLSYVAAASPTRCRRRDAQGLATCQRMDLEKATREVPAPQLANIIAQGYPSVGATIKSMRSHLIFRRRDDGVQRVLEKPSGAAG